MLTAPLGSPALPGRRSSVSSARSRRPPVADREPRVAIVTDTVDDLNGVALGLRRLTATARAQGLSLSLVGAGPGAVVFTDAEAVVRVPSWLDRELSVYPGMTWSVPLFLPLVRWLIEARIDVVQATTPGPMGMVAMAAGRMLGLPVVSQHHTEVGAYAQRLSGPALGRLADAVVSSFYRRADLCLAPSLAAEERLSSYGVPPSRIARVPRGVDLSLFHPSRRDRSVLARWGLAGRPVVLYVGRFSREKNLGALLAAFGEVRATHLTAALLVVGEGPCASELGGEGVVVAGPLRSADLAQVFASADVFAFPSETETFGNAVVEAQASGLPVVVAPSGAASETVLAGVTGIVAAPRDFARAIGALLDDPGRRARMGQAAHDHARRYDPVAAAYGTFALYRRVASRTR